MVIPYLATKTRQYKEHQGTPRFFLRGPSRSSRLLKFMLNNTLMEKEFQAGPPAPHKAHVISEHTENTEKVFHAADGIIIHDKENFLSDLIKKTRDYIKDRGIKRIKDGWQFPAAFRAVTFLSKVSNQDFAKAMFKDGERDFSIGKNPY